MSEVIGFSKADFIKKGQENGIDARKIGKIFSALLVIGALVWVVGAFVLPFLVGMAWNLVSLLIAAGATMLLGVILINIWNKLPLINAKIAKVLTFWIIEWDEFLIQEQQINKAEEDVDDMLAEREKIEGKYVELNQKLVANQTGYKENMKVADIARGNNDPDAADDAVLEAERNQTYIENIGPIVEDMKFIIDFSQEIQKVLKRKIKNAKADLQNNKDVFYAAQTGARMLNSAKKAMIGDVELNNQAEVAKARVKEKIALSIGQMRSSMQVLSDVTKNENYRSKAKMELAKQRLQEINNSTGEAVPVPMQSISFQNVDKIKKFGDIL